MTGLCGERREEKGSGTEVGEKGERKGYRNDIEEEWREEDCRGQG